MTAVPASRRHLPSDHSRPRATLYPRWLLRLVSVSLLLSSLLLLRACSLEEQRIHRAAAIRKGVSGWAREAGVGEVLFGSIKEQPLKNGSWLAEARVARVGDGTAPPQSYRWICTREGGVLRAFSQTEWISAQDEMRYQFADEAR